MRIYKISRKFYISLKNNAEEKKFLIKHAFVQEKMMPGSVLGASRRPASQCDVMVRHHGTDFAYTGQAFRVGEFLYTAAHVVEDVTGLRFVTEGSYIEIFDMLRITRVDGDIARVLLTPQEQGKLQLKTVKFSEVVSGKVLASCYARGVRSIGFVEPYDAFGYVKYSGSTQPGHSGAPYLVNNCVVGMHIGGHEINIGYDGQYLRMVHKKFEEDSEEFLWNQIEKGYIKTLEIRQSPYDPAEYQVKAGGKYYTSDKSDVEKFKAKGVRIRPYAGTQIEIEEEKVMYDEPVPTLEFQDQEQEAKNEVLAPAVAGAIGPVFLDQTDVPSQSQPDSPPTELCHGAIDRASTRLLSTLVQLRNHLETTLPGSTAPLEQANTASQMFLTQVKQEIRLLLDSLHGVTQ